MNDKYKKKLNIMKRRNFVKTIADSSITAGVFGKATTSVFSV